MTTKNLLLIDDEPAIGALLARTAGRWGYDVVRTTEPGAFRDACSRCEPDVILLDLEMPQKDGIEILRFLAARHSRALIAIISGLDSRILETSVLLGRELGLKMAPPLPKPFRAASLTAFFRSLQQEEGA